MGGARAEAHSPGFRSPEMSALGGHALSVSEGSAVGLGRVGKLAGCESGWRAFARSTCLPKPVGLSLPSRTNPRAG